MRCQSTTQRREYNTKELELDSLWKKAIEKDENRPGIFPHFCALLDHAFYAHVRRREEAERLGSCRYDELCIKRDGASLVMQEWCISSLRVKQRELGVSPRRAPWLSLPTHHGLADRPARMALVEHDRRSCGFLCGGDSSKGARQVR